MTKSKTKKKSTESSKKYQFYNADGTKKRRECPKCGKGVFLGQYKNPDRLVCGKCSYSEKIKKESKE